MSAPAIPIDSSIASSGTGEIMYVLEEASVWKTSNLKSSGASPATWTKVYTAAQFETAAMGAVEGTSFVRVIAATDLLIYVLGFSYTIAELKTHPWIFRSQNGGVSWSAFQVSGALDLGSTFVFEGLMAWKPEVEPYDVSYNGTTGEIIFMMSSDGSIQYPELETAAVIRVEPPLPLGAFTFSFDAKGNFDIDYIGTPGKYPWAQFSSTTTYNNTVFTDITVTPIAGGVNISGTMHTDLEGGDAWLDRSRFAIGFFFGWPGRGPTYETFLYLCSVSNIMIDGVLYKATPYMCMDVAPTNNNWLYVGLEDRILACEDGGLTWFDFNTTHGANDLLVDPALAEYIYYWATDGNLNLMVKTASGVEGFLLNEGLMTETAVRLPFRIAKIPESFTILTLPSGTDLAIRSDGSNTTLETGYDKARGLHYYSGQKIIFVDNDNIYTSEDILSSTPTVSSKKGSLSGFYRGVNAYRLP